MKPELFDLGGSVAVTGTAIPVDGGFSVMG
jgi:hypothetical protein